jgi:hypothetical protein
MAKSFAKLLGLFFFFFCQKNKNVKVFCQTVRVALNVRALQRTKIIPQYFPCLGLNFSYNFHSKRIAGSKNHVTSFGQCVQSQMNYRYTYLASQPSSVVIQDNGSMITMCRDIPLFGWAYQHGLSAVEQCFSLTANQPQQAYKPKKQPAEQGHLSTSLTIWSRKFKPISKKCFPFYY